MNKKHKTFVDHVKSLCSDPDAALDNPYEPFRDLDKNGVIIITPLLWIEPNPNRMIFMNISTQFTPGGLREFDPERLVKIDFENKTDQCLAPSTLKQVLRHIERLYTNELDQLVFDNLPQMNYNALAGMDISDLAAAQWERSDLDKLGAHIRMLYDPSLRMQ